MKPLSVDFLTSCGRCCGKGCENCPYDPRHEFGSTTIGTVAQWSEQVTHNNLVAGSIPAGPTNEEDDAEETLPKHPKQSSAVESCDGSEDGQEPDPS